MKLMFIKRVGSTDVYAFTHRGVEYGLYRHKNSVTILDRLQPGTDLRWLRKESPGAGREVRDLMKQVLPYLDDPLAWEEDSGIRQWYFGVVRNGRVKLVPPS